MGDGRPYNSSGVWTVGSILVIVLMLLYSYYEHPKENTSMSRGVIKELVSVEISKLVLNKGTGTSSR